MAYNNVFRSLECTILNESGKAVQVSYTGSNGLLITEWFPKSQLNGIYPNDDITIPDVILASEWILKQKNATHLSKAVEAKLVVVTSVPIPAIRPRPAPNFSDMDDDIPF